MTEQALSELREEMWELVGWRPCDTLGCCWVRDGKHYREFELPDFPNSETACFREIVPAMEEKGYSLFTRRWQRGLQWVTQACFSRTMLTDGSSYHSSTATAICLAAREARRAGKEGA